MKEYSQLEVTGRFIPSGSVPIVDEEAHAVVYVSESMNVKGVMRYYAMAYCSKRKRNDFYFSYSTKEARDEKVKEYFEGCKSTIKWKAERKQKQGGSNHAMAAKAIREELKKAFPEVKFSVKSDSFSGGDSVDIRYTDGPASKKVEAYTDKYQYGHFNGMIDMYESSNRRDDIPQVKFVHVSREISKEVNEKIEKELKEKYADFNPSEWMESHRCYGNNLIYRETVDRDF